MRVGLVSLNQVWEDKIANLVIATDYTATAAKANCDLVIFPEMTLTGFSMNVQLITEEVDTSATIQQFRSLSSQYKIAIIFGVVLTDSSNTENCLVFINPAGEINKYAKIHTFSFAKEPTYYQNGKVIGFANLNDCNIGLTICYDLRFPELYSILAEHCPIIINIANWPSKRIDHWHTLLKARAIEQQIFMLAVNRVGTDGNGLHYEKSSCVIGPSGVVLQPLITINNLDIYNLNLQQLDECRQAFPIRRDRKVKIYLDNYEEILKY